MPKPELPEESDYIYSMPLRRRLLAVFAIALAGGTGASIANHVHFFSKQEPVAPNATKVNPVIKEPHCNGVTIKEVDQYNFEISPTLSGFFVDPYNVVTYLAVGGKSTTAPTSANHKEASGTLINAEQATNFTQEGVGYTLGANTASRVPSRIEMFDFQNNIPPYEEGTFYIPTGVPEISCPTIDLGQDVQHLLATPRS